MGQLNDAIKEFDKAIKLKADNEDYYHNRANTKRIQKKFMQAIDDYKKALDIEKDKKDHIKFERSLCDMAVTMMQINEFETALDNFNKALEIMPDDDIALYARGILFVNMGDKDKALSDFKKASSLGNQQAADWINENT